MTPDTDYADLAADLAALGRALPETTPDVDLTVAVMERVAELPAPTYPHRHQRLVLRVAEALRHRRRVAVAVAAVLTALAVTPPVRAAVADWFDFAGVIVRDDPTYRPSSAPPPSPAGTSTTLAEARRLVAFAPSVPAALGRPQGVEVSADRRLLSMSWTGGRDGAMRLDQFDGRLDYAFAKRAPGVEFTSVAGSFALWFDEPHEVVVLNPDGSRRTETARLAGHTLIWEYGGTTLRLEGDVSLVRATVIAESTTSLS